MTKLASKYYYFVKEINLATCYAVQRNLHRTLNKAPYEPSMSPNGSWRHFVPVLEVKVPLFLYFPRNKLEVLEAGFFNDISFSCFNQVRLGQVKKPS